MKEYYCEICDYSELGFNNDLYCELWNCLIEEVKEGCDDRVVDGK